MSYSWKISHKKDGGNSLLSRSYANAGSTMIRRLLLALLLPTKTALLRVKRVISMIEMLRLIRFKFPIIILVKKTRKKERNVFEFWNN